MKKTNPKLKVLISMAEGKEEAEKYSRVIADLVRRRRLVSSISDFLEFHKFDGFDFVWEYPTQHNYVRLFLIFFKKHFKFIFYFLRKHLLNFYVNYALNLELNF